MMHSESSVARSAVLLALVFAGLSWRARPARAQETAQACASAYEEAQRLRARGALKQASHEAQVCSQVECNQFIVQECIKLYEQIQADTPSMIFTARNGDGEELNAVQVQVDGQVVAERLDGRPIDLDPGPHTFRFEAAGLPPLETKHTARVGDRNRVIEVMLGEKRAPQPPPPALAPTSPLLPPQGGTRHAQVPVGTWVLGGLGIVGLGAFGYLRLAATNEYNDFATTCSPRCDPKETDKVHTKFQLSYVALGVGAVSLGGAALVYVLTREKDGARESSVALVPTEDGLRAGWRTRF
ncbi:MAG TPA: hypothetical protein VFQ61_26285 [Polyangiaceae bacterium]|nr:hypothetical protein [Polyangiaceae bacterium]